MKKVGRLFAFSFIGLFIFSILLSSLSITTAQTSPTDVTLSSGSSSWSGAFSTLFTNWTAGVMEANIAKIFFFIMITLVIYLLGSSVMPNSTVIVMILSALISFLATAYITPAEVYSMLLSYSALGLTITTIIPLIVIGMLTYQSAKTMNVQLIMLQYFAWILFAIYSIYRIIYDYAYVHQGNGVVNAIILVTAIAAVIAVFANGFLRKTVAKQYLKAEGEAAEARIKKSAKFTEVTAKGLEGLSKPGP